MEVDAGNDRGVEPRERVVGKKLGLLRDSTRSRPRRMGKDPDSFPLPDLQTSLCFLAGEVRISEVGNLVAALTRQILPCSPPGPDRRLDLVKLRPQWYALLLAPVRWRLLPTREGGLVAKSGDLQGVVEYLRPD